MTNTKLREEIPGLHLETGGSVVVSANPRQVTAPQHIPSNTRIFTVFGGSLVLLLVGAFAGFKLSEAQGKATIDAAQLQAFKAHTAAQRNQRAIDAQCTQMVNFCAQKASFGSEFGKGVE